MAVAAGLSSQLSDEQGLDVAALHSYGYAAQMLVEVLDFFDAAVAMVHFYETLMLAVMRLHSPLNVAGLHWQKNVVQQMLVCCDACCTGAGSLHRLETMSHVSPFWQES